MRFLSLFVSLTISSHTLCFGFFRIFYICEGIAVLNFGRIIAKGTPDEIRDNPQVIEAYLGKKEG